MNDRLDYWKECVSLGAEECGLQLTAEQLTTLAESVESGHDNYGMAFYSPPSSDRLNAIEREWKAKYDELKKEFDGFQKNANEAVRRAFNVHREDGVSIGEHGDVFRHGGRTTRIQ